MAAGAEHQHRAVRCRLQGHHAIDVQVFCEQVLHAAQVTELFLAHIAHEHQVAHGGDAVVVEHLEPGQQHGQAARVVGDARRIQAAVALLDLHVGARREHRVHMGRDHQLGALARALAHTDHVAFGINGGTGEPQCFHAGQEGLGTLLLLEGRCLDLGEQLQVGDRTLVVGLDGVEQLLDLRGGHELRVGLVHGGAQLGGRGGNGLGMGRAAQQGGDGQGNGAGREGETGGTGLDHDGKEN